MNTASDLARTHLADIATALELDGYLMKVTESGPGRLTVSVAATDSACADCLVPKDMFRGIVAERLRAGGLGLIEEIEILYPK